VTDSDIALGYIVSDAFAEGHLVLDPEASNEALTRVIGAKLDLDAIGSADGVSRIVDESMASAGRMHAVETGKNLGQRTMIAFGGNGPVHASRVARSAGISHIVIPPNPSVGSAIGFLFAPVSFEIVRSRYSLLNSMDLNLINGLFDEMIQEAKSVVSQGAGGAPTVTQRSAFMRYNGQGHEIEIALPDRVVTAKDIHPLTTAFEDEYRKQFSRPVPGMEIEILNWAIRVATQTEKIRPVVNTPAVNTITPSETRPIICDLDGTVKNAAFVARTSLKPGDRVCGPALVHEPQTTTLVSADFSAHLDAIGNLVLMQDQKGDA
jgi:N-methylhydantoinase A